MVKTRSQSSKENQKENQQEDSKLIDEKLKKSSLKKSAVKKSIKKKATTTKKISSKKPSSKKKTTPSKKKSKTEISSDENEEDIQSPMIEEEKKVKKSKAKPKVKSNKKLKEELSNDENVYLEENGDESENSQFNSFSTFSPFSYLDQKSSTTTENIKKATESVSNQLKALANINSEKDGIEIEIVDDNVLEWNVKFFNFDKNEQLSKDLKQYKEKTGRGEVLLRVSFPPTFPADPPFMRVVYPRFHQYTGHITIGGSVCIQDLTKSGWNSKNKIFPFLVMIRNLLVEGKALVNFDFLHDYSEQEAKSAFYRVANFHGWKY